MDSLGSSQVPQEENPTPVELTVLHTDGIFGFTSHLLKKKQKVNDFKHTFILQGSLDSSWFYGSFLNGFCSDLWWNGSSFCRTSALKLQEVSQRNKPKNIFKCWWNGFMLFFFRKTKSFWRIFMFFQQPEPKNFLGCWNMNSSQRQDILISFNLNLISFFCILLLNTERTSA